MELEYDLGIFTGQLSPINVTCQYFVPSQMINKQLHLSLFTANTQKRVLEHFNYGIFFFKQKGHNETCMYFVFKKYYLKIVSINQIHCFRTIKIY